MNVLFGCYLLLSGLALAGPYRPAWWPALAAAHALLAAVAFTAARRDPRPGSRTGVLEWLRDFYPLLVMPLLYAELPLLNQSLYRGYYFDDIVIGWERALFGGEPARELAAAAPWSWLSEPLHAAYISYYAIIYGPPLLVAWRRGHAAAAAAVFTLSLVFFAHYLFFVYFPVEGPRYRFPPPGGEIADGAAYGLAHTLLEAGSSRGAAFPSSHVGVSVAATVICWRMLRPLTPIVALLTVGLAVGAVYGGFHYAIDAVAGAAFGLALALAAPALQRALESDRDSSS